MIIRLRWMACLLLVATIVAADGTPRPFHIMQTPLGLEFVHIPACETPMRWVEQDGERIARLSAFWCARHGLTKAMYRRFAHETGTPLPDYFGPPQDMLAVDVADYRKRSLQLHFMAPTESHVFAEIHSDHIAAVLVWLRQMLVSRT